MEFLSRLGEPILERLRSLPWQSRLAGIAFGVIIAAGLLLLRNPTVPTDFVPLMDGRELSEPQLARMTSAFRKHRLDEAKISGHTIEIPRTEKHSYLMALDEEDAWPADFDDPVDRALAGTNPLMPWQQNRENLERGEKQMLARIVEEMNGIETAAVQYDEIRLPGFPPRVEVRAVVAVKAVDHRHLEVEEIEAVRDTVVAFKSGLERENVTITDLNACRAYPGGQRADTSQDAARIIAAAKQRIEEEFRSKIEQRLSMYPDPVVAVNAHFAEQPRIEAVSPGLSADDANPMRLVQVTASIDISKSYFADVWRQRRGVSLQQPPEPEQLREIEQEICGTIERAVLAMLPPPAPGWQSSEQVTVTSHDELQPTSTTAKTIAGLPTWGWLIAVALGLVATSIAIATLYVRRRTQVVKAPTNDSRPWVSHAEFESLRPVADAMSGQSADFVELQQQLTGVVRSNPAAAAEILKQWLSRAA